jgi:hypothetical protein
MAIGEKWQRKDESLSMKSLLSTSGSSKVVVHLTTQPEIGSLSPIAAWQQGKNGREKMSL